MVAGTMENKASSLPSAFMSCDWGTTSFRLKLVETESARILAEVSGDRGIKKIHDQWTAQQKSSSRSDYYRTFLGKQITKLQAKTNQPLSSLPLLISGMASSSIGIRNLPYGKLPVSLDSPNLKVDTIKPDRQFPHPLYLISGVQSSEDVMRGEETQLIGLSAITEVNTALCLLVGTHSKHVDIADNILTGFRTYMTGELFDLLSTRSILSHSVEDPGAVGPGPAFEQGLQDSRQNNLLHALFKTRTHDLLDQTMPSDSYDYLSGLLIGTELNEVDAHHRQKILLWGDQRIARYYAAALDIFNINYLHPDLDPATDVTAQGHRVILARITN